MIIQHEEALSQEATKTVHAPCSRRRHPGTSPSKTAAPMYRTGRRQGVEATLRAARFLPSQDRCLLRAMYIHQKPIARIACLQGVSVPMLRRRVRSILRRIADPCFLLTVQFATRRLPPHLARIAKLHYHAGVPLHACAAQLRISHHRARKLLHDARTLLILAGVRKYGGADANRRLVIASLLDSGDHIAFHPARLRRCAASAARI